MHSAFPLLAGAVLVTVIRMWQCVIAKHSLQLRFLRSYLASQHWKRCSQKVWSLQTMTACGRLWCCVSGNMTGAAMLAYVIAAKPVSRMLCTCIACRVQKCPSSHTVQNNIDIDETAKIVHFSAVASSKLRRNAASCWRHVARDAARMLKLRLTRFVALHVSVMRGARMSSSCGARRE